MNVLSLFDGISCGQIALERAGIKYNTYYASEIDKYAIQVTKKNYPNTIHIGDVNEIDFNEYIGEIDLLLGGSPCQGFSKAGKGLNFNDPRSKLFFKFAEALNIIKPKYFLLENVKMKKEWIDIISKYLKVEPIHINSILVSAQNRNRLYWTNIPNVQQPEDKNIILQDILEKGIAIRNKSKTVRVGGRLSNDRHEWDLATTDGKRYSTLECERLQTLPDKYTYGIPEGQRYKCIGNCWTVDIIAHIFKNIIYKNNIINIKQKYISSIDYNTNVMV